MTAAAEARALIAAGRAHDDAMTDGPWEIGQYGESVRRVYDDQKFAGMDVVYKPVTQMDAAGIAWLRTNLRSLLDGYAAALDEVDHSTAHDGDHLSKASRRMVDTVMDERDALRLKVREITALVEAGAKAVDALEGIEQRTGTELLARRAEVGELKLVIEQQDRDMAGLESGLREACCWISDRSPDSSILVDRLRVLLPSTGAPCTETKK